MSNSTCRSGVLVAVIAVALGGCYKATFTTGLPPGGGQHEVTVRHFLFGLVGGGELSFGGMCPAGVASVHEEKSFLDLLIAGLTGYLYEPRSVRVECAAGMPVMPVYGVPPGYGPPPAAM